MRKILGALAGCGLVVACTAGPAPAPPAPEPAPPAPPAPPAACLLDTAALATATGVEWAPDPVTATDTRCVYDTAGEAFLVVERVADTDVETPAALCDDGTRTTLAAGGWVCRFGEGVFGAGSLDDRLVTIAAATVPPGTDATRLLTAFGGELDRLATA